MKFIRLKNKINKDFLKGVYKNFKVNNLEKFYLNKFNIKDLQKYKQNIKKTFLKQNQKSLKKDKEKKLLKNKKRAYFNELFNSDKEGGLLSIPANINKLKNKIDLKLKLKNFKLKIKNKLYQKSQKSTNLENKLSLPPQVNKFFYKYFSKKKDAKEKLIDDSFLIIHFSDHVLSIAKISTNESINSFEQLININIPTDIVGDYKVENKNEFSNILKDVISLYDAQTNPIILLLSSTFFTIKSFSDGELVVFSENNPELLSKSPFLPDDTLMQHTRVSGNKLSSYHRVVYINKNVLDSWIEVLSRLDNPLAGVTSSCIHLVEEITTKEGGLTILCDIELNATVIYIEKNNCEFNTVKLPFGASIYISDDENVAHQFFVRLENAVNSIIEKFNYKSPKSIYLIGQGFDKLNTSSISSFNKFKEFPSDIFNKYKFNKDIDKEIIQNNISNITKLSSITQIANK